MDGAQRVLAGTAALATALLAACGPGADPAAASSSGTQEAVAAEFPAPPLPPAPSPSPSPSDRTTATTPRVPSATPPSPTAPSSPSPTAPTTTTPSPDADGPLPPTADPGAVTAGEPAFEEEFAADYAHAITVVDGYWTEHWDEVFTGTYAPPVLATGADGIPGMYDAPADAVPCDGAVRVDLNAQYCALEDSVGFDVDLMLLSQRLGDAFVYLVVAHEWGHAVAARLDVALVPLDAELQADCFAGAALWGAVADGELTVEEGDTAELVASLTEAADSSPWAAPGDHGDAVQRIGAFDRGRAGGPAACLPPG